MSTPDPEALERARELILARQSELYRLRALLQQRRETLLAELQAVERQAEALNRRIEGIRDVLTIDLPAARLGRAIPLHKLSVPEAAAALLKEAGGYLTNAQLKGRLEEHGIAVDDTTQFGEQLMAAASSQEVPLLPLRDKLWAHADWVEQARFSIPEPPPEPK